MIGEEAAFSTVNLIALAGWLLLVAFPRNGRALFTAGTVVPLLLSTIYLGLLAVHFGEGSGSFSSLQGVADLFSNRWILLAGWVHYLAFDLFIGAWETKDAMARGLSRWLLAPCLALTFMLGPVGLLAYHAARLRVRGRSGENTKSRKQYEASVP
jgi:Domain of unknown function (DUF4281)